MRLHKAPVSIVPAVLVGSTLASVSFGAANNPGLFSTGTLPVRASVTMGVNRSDNRDLVKDGYVVNGKPVSKESQTTMFVGPTFSFAKELMDRYNVFASYSPVYTWYDNCRAGQDENKWEHTLRVALNYNISPRLLFKISDNYWWSGQKDTFYGDDFEYDPNRDERLNNDYAQNRVRATLHYDLSDYDYVELTGRHRIKRYEEDELADYNDEDEYGARVDYFHVFSDRLSLGAFADYTSWDRESKNTESPVKPYRIDLGVDYVTFGAQALVDLTGTKNHVLKAQFGWNHAWYEADELDDQDNFDTLAEVRLFQLHETQLIGGVRYGHDFSDVYPFSTQEDLAGYASLVQYLDNRRFKASASLELRTRTYDLSDDLDPSAWKYGYAEALKEANGGKTSYDRDSVYFRLAASYKIVDWLRATAFYSVEDIDSDVGSSYTENVFGLSATVDLF